MERLFIGGPEDGKWHNLSGDHEFWEVPASKISMGEDFKIISYRRERLVSKNGQEYAVMVCVEDDEPCLIETLLAGYNPT